jgi:hypothetical protein
MYHNSRCESRRQTLRERDKKKSYKERIYHYYIIIRYNIQFHSRWGFSNLIGIAFGRVEEREKNETKMDGIRKKRTERKYSILSAGHTAR